MSNQNSDAAEASIDEALMTYSSQIPAFRWDVIQPGTKLYKVDPTKDRPNLIAGVVRVDFIEPYNAFGMGATGIGITQNLTGVAIPPVLSESAGGSGEIVTFIQWRKSFQRVTSRKPSWIYDDLEGAILINNPVNYPACAMISIIRTFEQVRQTHKPLLAKMALASAKKTLGEIRGKFQDIKGPGMTSVGINGTRLQDSGDKEWDACIVELKAVRPRLIPFWD